MGSNKWIKMRDARENQDLQKSVNPEISQLLMAQIPSKYIARISEDKYSNKRVPSTTIIFI